MNKQDYLKGLKDAERVETEVKRDEPTPAKAEKAQKAPVDAPPPAPAAPAPVAAAPAAPPAAAPVAAPATPAELFPGFNAMPKEIQESIAAKFALAEQAANASEEAKRLKRDFQLSQQRLTPMQQQLAQAQRERAELTERLKAADAARPPRPDVKAHLEDMRANFPDDAAMFDAALTDAEQAKGQVVEMQKRFEALEQRLFIQSQLAELSTAHPDWQKKRVGVLMDESGTFHPDEQGRIFVATAETPEAQELEVWSNSLDDYDKQIIARCLVSKNARDTIYALNRFEQDRAVARVLASQNGSGVPSAEGSPPAPPAPPTPEVDPNPATRQTAPTRSSAGQPVSEKKRQFLEAAAFLKKQKELQRQHA